MSRKKAEEYLALKYGLEPLRCSSCGRFMGYMAIRDGISFLLCKNCDGWSMVAEGKTGKALTSEQIDDILTCVGRKA